MFKIKNLVKILILSFLIFGTLSVFGKESDRLKGYAWSDGAGWISFNCSNTNSCDVVDYGVTTDSSGNLSGYAWSDHLGWLSFNYDGVLWPAGSVAPKLDLATGNLSGNAYFIGGHNPNDDGWSGLIDLTSNPYISDGVVLDNQGASPSFEFGGWSWGDVNAGWISFNCSNTSSCGVSDYRVTYDPFFFEFTANRGLVATDKVPYNGSVNLSWITIDAVGNCTASQGGTTNWVADSPYASGNETKNIPNLTSNTTFDLTCQDASGNSITRSLDILVKPPAPMVTIGADDTNIAYNTSTNINWTAQNVSSCTASGDWSGSKDPSGGTENSGNLTNPVNVFTISCDSDNPSEYPDPVTASVTVNVEKLVVKLWPDYNPVPYNEKIKLFYETEFPTSGTCVPAGGDVPGWNTATIDESPGEHSFTTANPITDGNQYTATLGCDGSNGQHETVTVIINARKKPTYQEI